MAVVGNPAVWHRHGQRSRRYYAQLGGDLDTNSNKITFADPVNAEFGNDGDPKIFRNGGHPNSTGNRDRDPSPKVTTMLYFPLIVAQKRW